MVYRGVFSLFMTCCLLFITFVGFFLAFLSFYNQFYGAGSDDQDVIVR
jgi:hypothetical protein